MFNLLSKVLQVTTNGLEQLNQDLDETLERQKFNLAKSKANRPIVIAKAVADRENELAKILAKTERLNYLTNADLLTETEATELQLLLNS